MEIDQIVGIVSLIIAFTAVISGYHISRRNELALSQWIKEIREWAGESISALVAAQYAADSRQAPQAITDHIIHLTTLTDQGRLLLPNVRKDEYGHHKSEAFQGYRHPTLDILVAAVVVLKNSQDYEDRSLYLVAGLRDPAKVNGR